MLSPQLVTPPDPPCAVDLDDLKAHLNVDINEFDVLIDSLGIAATKHVDGWTGILGGLCLLTQTWSQAFENFPCGAAYVCPRSSVMKNVLRLKLAPLIAITSVKYRDSAGVQQTLSSSNYRAQEDALGWFIAAAPGVSSPWPSSLQSRNDAIVVEAKFGFGGAADVPEDLRGAIANRVKKNFTAARQRDLSLSRETVDGVGSQEWRGNTEMIAILDAEFDAVVRNYKRSWFA